MFEETIKRAFRAVFGGGADINAGNPLQVYDPKVYNALVVYEGTATADGPDTSTITDTVLATKPDFNGQLVVITSGAYNGQTRNIDQATDAGGGKVHVAAAFGGTIVSGVTFVILSIRPTTAEVADIEAKLDHVDHGLAALQALLDAILLDTGTTIPDDLAIIAAYVDALEIRLTVTRGGYLDRIKNLTRPQKGTQATTNALVVVGAAIVDTVPFKVSGFLSLHNMQAGDTFLVIEEIRDQDDATYREYARTSYSDVQTSPMIWFEEKVCQGWRVRIQRTAGADRDITYQFFKEVASA